MRSYKLLLILYFGLLLLLNEIYGNDSLLVISQIEFITADSVLLNNSNDESLSVERFEQLVQKTLSSDSKYNNVLVDSLAIGQRLTKRLLHDKNAQFIMSLPRNQQPVSFQNTSGGTVLFLENIGLEYNPDNIENVKLSLEYAFWDNQNSRLLKYGSKSADTECNPENIGACLPILVEEIFTVMKQEKTIEYAKDVRNALSLKILPSHYFHLIKRDEDNPNIPNIYENPREHPSVAHFFSDNFSFGAAMEYCYYKDEGRFTIGLIYHYESIEDEGSKRDILTLNFEDQYGQQFQLKPISQSLDISSFGLNLSYGKSLDEMRLTYAYGKIEISSKNYESTLDFDGTTADLQLDDNMAFAFMIGIDTQIKNTSIQISAELGYEICSTTLQSVVIQSQSQPLQDGELSDDRIVLRFGIANIFDF